MMVSGEYGKTLTDEREELHREGHRSKSRSRKMTRTLLNYYDTEVKLQLAATAACVAILLSVKEANDSLRTLTL